MTRTGTIRFTGMKASSTDNITHMMAATDIEAALSRAARQSQESFW